MNSTILAILGFLTVVTVLVLIMTKKATPTVSLIMVPVITGIISCFFTITDGQETVNVWANIQNLGKYITGSSGIGSVAVTGVMFVFSILFFGILTDAGAFRPIIKAVTDKVGADPIKVCIGTAALTMIAHLDGSGATTFLIVVPPLVPLYDALKMRRTTLATIAALAAGTMNIMPWGGPTIRAATAFSVDVMEMFKPVLPSVVLGLATVFVISYYLGVSEKKRIGNSGNNSAEKFEYVEPELTEEQKALLRPNLFIVNIGLIIVTVLGLLFSGLTPAVIFIVMYCLATLINYPDVNESKKRVDAHAKSAMLMCSVLFAAGVFTGIMKQTSMISEMAKVLASLIPASLGKYFAIITGVISMPASLLFDPDSFYYGVLPILGNVAENFGANAISIGRAAILGQMSTGFPVSPLTPASFLLTGLAGVDFGEHQKKTIPLAFVLTLIMLVISIVIGAI